MEVVIALPAEHGDSCLAGKYTTQREKVLDAGLCRARPFNLMPFQAGSA